MKMKITLRVTTLDDMIGFHILFDDDIRELLSGEEPLFDVSHEGDSEEPLLPVVVGMAIEEANRRGIKVHGLK